MGILTTLLGLRKKRSDLKGNIQSCLANIQLALKAKRYLSISLQADLITTYINSYHARVMAGLRKRLDNEYLLDAIQISIDNIRATRDKDKIRHELATLQSLLKQL